MVWRDFPVANVLVIFALVALFLPASWHSIDVTNSKGRQTAYAGFAAEFLDSIQGLATLKAFGQSSPRAVSLEKRARDLSRRTMWVLGTNVLSRGITDCAITIGAAAECYRIYGKDPILGNYISQAYPGLIDAASMIGSIQIQGRASV